MNEEQETLPLFDNTRKAEQLIIKLYRLIGVNPKSKNAFGNAEAKLFSEREKYEQTLEKEAKYKEEICRIVGAKDFTAAKKRIASVFAKLGRSTKVPVLFNLDTSFLEGVGSLWDRNAPGKDPVAMIQNLHKKLDHQRAIVVDVYEKFLDKVLASCYEQGFGEDPTRVEIDRWHSAMKEDFDLLTVPEFWQKYCGDLHDISVMPKEPQTALLHDALPLIKLYAPVQVYQELYDDDPERLGYIPRYKLDKWTDRATSLKTLSGDALATEKYTLTADILSEAAFRRIEGPEAVLMPGTKETTLRFILTHEDVNPYGREFSVDDNTSFLRIQELYSKYSGETK